MWLILKDKKYEMCDYKRNVDLNFLRFLIAVKFFFFYNSATDYDHRIKLILY